ncbi:YceI family protein [Phenylobacterium sp.]|uniref:YceI family protein n=1 Tax=Phenylobacterium sp. TaxID=1871053 RepID=UPI002725219C|nr:YceI family protein [Phenylobacterium sp.]MDO8800869.1 YceI family protein [Phenylobacterium sp.]
MKTQDRYRTPAIVLHWLIAAAILFQMQLPWRFHGLKTPEAFALIQLHKSVGITILVLSLARLGWRLANPPPPEPETLAPWERWLSQTVHWGLYVLMIGMPITGWIMVSTSKTGIPTVLWGAIPWPHAPGFAAMASAGREVWNGVAQETHELLGWGFYLLIGLHVAGALKHQLFSRDEPVLARMVPGAVAGRWLEPRLALIALGVVFAIGGAWLIHPKPTASAPLPPPLVQTAEPVTPVVTPAAVPAPIAEVAAAPAEASKWTVAKSSTLGFSTSWGGQALEGRFDQWTADIAFSPDALDRSHVKVTIDLASVATGDPQRDVALPGADFFDVAQHPRAIFTADRFEAAGQNRYVAHGKLALRGVTKPVRLPFTLKIDGDKARMSGVTSLDRTAFGVGQGEWQATDQIPAQVKVSVQLTATR